MVNEEIERDKANILLHCNTTIISYHIILYQIILYYLILYSIICPSTGLARCAHPAVCSSTVSHLSVSTTDLLFPSFPFFYFCRVKQPTACTCEPAFDKCRLTLAQELLPQPRYFPHRALNGPQLSTVEISSNYSKYNRGECSRDHCLASCVL